MSYLDGSSYRLSPAQLATVGRQVGFSGDDLVMFVAVCLAESSGEAHIVHPNPDGTDDLGIAQINTVHKHEADVLLAAGPGFFTLKGWKDPIANGRAARQIKNRKGNWTDWVTFNVGATNEHLTAARAAVNGTNPGDQYTGGSGAGNGSPGGTGGGPVVPYTINGHRVDDPVWKQFFDTEGKLVGIGDRRDNGYGKMVVRPIQKDMGDGTRIVSLSSDDISHYSSLSHVKIEGGKQRPISVVTMQNEKLVGYITKDGTLIGETDDGGGAVELPLLGIPDAITGLTNGEFLADAIKGAVPYLWIAAGAIAIGIVVVTMLKNSSVGKTAASVAGKVVPVL